MCVNNMRHGPWSDAALHEKLVEGMSAYQRCTPQEECPIFSWLLPRIIRDMDLEHRLADASLASEIWDGLKESKCFLNTGIHINASRWFGANNAFRREFDQSWHSLALGKLYVALQTGAVTGSRFEQVMAKLKVPAEDADGTGMKQGQNELRSMRALAKNNLQLALCYLLNPMNQMMERVTNAVSYPLWEWFGVQSKTLTSTAASASWLLGQVSGGVLQHCKDILGTLSRPSVLQYIGFCWPLTPAASRMSSFSPAAIDEQELAALMGSFALSLAGSRTVRCAWFSTGWPAKSVLFMSPDPALVQATLDEFKAEVDLFSLMKQQDTMFWRGCQEVAVPDSRCATGCMHPGRLQLRAGHCREGVVLQKGPQHPCVEAG